jgi:plasmid stabilization system protein ParE
MPHKRPIIFAESAFRDLEDIQAWYPKQQAPSVGDRLVGETIVQIGRLADFPESGRIVPEFGIARLREIVYPSFRIVYRLDGNKVKIIRVWRSERLLTMPL